MRDPRSFVVFLGVLVASAAERVLQADDEVLKSRPSTDAQVRFFETKIRPLLIDRCYECHGEETQESDLRLDTLEGMLRGGTTGPAFVSGEPQRSLIVTAVSYRDSELRMPPDEKLTKQQIADLTRWVRMGAPHPRSGTVEIQRQQSTIDLEAGRRHWAFQPPVKPDVPTNGDLAEKNADHPIDAFVQAALRREGLVPVDRADKETLLRRATFDLIGLPPTTAEIDAFLADASDEAFERVVDRLLQSPHYGERWGRHWLDVARYADSNGLDENAAHGNAWRYRDWVVESFNNDQPYDEFLREQLAGDLLDSGDDTDRKHRRLIATGYLVLGPKVLAEVDERKMEMDIVDEQIDTIGRGLLGVTLGCARCHDHKFDPFGQNDYYALAGIFQSTRTMESFKKVAKWNETSIADAEDRDRQERHERLVAEAKQQIEDRVAEAKSELPSPQGEETSAEVEKRFSTAAQDELKTLREKLTQLEESAPGLPTAMAVTDAEVADSAVHLRGSHLTLGETVPRRFPRVFAGDEQPSLPNDSSGRLEFSRWLTSDQHPLTARVMVNRIWRWHFGKGLVPTVDNFGLQGEPPTHPQLLDWLAVRFVESGWSIKAMHRLIMLSETYQRSNRFDARNAAVDGGNRFYWRSDVRRLEAEAIRDALLAVSGTLDLTIGGSLLQTPNRQLVFNHTSEDQSDYNIRRRSIYVPVIRNHLYDLFQLFDYTDASVLTGNRGTSTIAPQALFLMNSEFMTEVAASTAERLLALDVPDERRIVRLFREAYGRTPSEREAVRSAEFLREFGEQSHEDGRIRAWQALCRSVVSSSEFVYVR